MYTNDNATTFLDTRSNPTVIIYFWKHYVKIPTSKSCGIPLKLNNNYITLSVAPVFFLIFIINNYY